MPELLERYQEIINQEVVDATSDYLLARLEDAPSYLMVMNDDDPDLILPASSMARKVGLPSLNISTNPNRDDYYASGIESVSALEPTEPRTLPNFSFTLPGGNWQELLTSMAIIQKVVATRSQMPGSIIIPVVDLNLKEFPIPQNMSITGIDFFEAIFNFADASKATTLPIIASEVSRSSRADYKGQIAQACRVHLGNVEEFSELKFARAIISAVQARLPKPKN